MLVTRKGVHIVRAVLPETWGKCELCGRVTYDVRQLNSNCWVGPPVSDYTWRLNACLDCVRWGELERSPYVVG